MEAKGRTERRFFFPVKYHSDIISRLDNHNKLSQLNFNCPVCETIYFTLGKKENYAVPEDFYIRMRKYVSRQSRIILIGNSPFFLEVKTKDTKKGQNLKTRLAIDGYLAIRALMHLEKCGNIIPNITLPPMFPTAAIQTYRLHWVLANKIRITLDHNFRFFGFFEKNWLTAYQMGVLKEEKIEFKFKKQELDLINLVDEILTGCQYQSREPFYIEGRMRQCYAQWR